MVARSWSCQMPRSEHFRPWISKGPEVRLSSAWEDEGLAGVGAAEVLWRVAGDGRERRKGHVTEGALGQGKTSDFDFNYTRSPLRAWHDLVYDSELSLRLHVEERKSWGAGSSRGASPLVAYPITQMHTELRTGRGACKLSAVSLLLVFMCDKERILPFSFFLNLNRKRAPNPQFPQKKSLESNILEDPE